jgi:hypothetical protein
VAIVAEKSKAIFDRCCILPILPSFLGRRRQVQMDAQSSEQSCHPYFLAIITPWKRFSRPTRFGNRSLRVIRWLGKVQELWSAVIRLPD